jgi:hypothetical protein
MINLLLTAALVLNATPSLGKTGKPEAIAKTTARAEALQPVLNSVSVTLECTAKADGQVEGCRVLGETHPGLGFAETAMALMEDARVAPGPRDFQFARTIQFMP